MSEPKWTPGPWVVRQTVLHGKTYGGHWVEPENEDQLISLTGSGGAMSYTHRVVDRQDHDDNEANAYLIAAAPKLYDALSRLIDNVETGSYESTGQAIAEARIVLAEARGEKNGQVADC